MADARVEQKILDALAVHPYKSLTDLEHDIHEDHDAVRLAMHDLETKGLVVHDATTGEYRLA